MSVTRDGTQAFGIESSPVEINAITYVVEGLSFGYEGERKDILNSDGEPLGATTVPGFTTVSGTLQLAAADTAVDIRQQTMTLSGTRNDGIFLITDCSEAETQADYVKVAFNGYQQIN